jgi:hypothetical protein
VTLRPTTHIDSEGKTWILESGVWFGPFLADTLFRLESHCKAKDFYSQGISPQIAEFAYCKTDKGQNVVWILEAKSSVAKKENASDFDANLQQWANKLANSITVIAGIRVGAFAANMNLSEIPAFVRVVPFRDLEFKLVVVLTAKWPTDSDCQAMQIVLSQRLAQSVRAWKIKGDSVYVFNREWAIKLGLASGEQEPPP